MDKYWYAVLTRVGYEYRVATALRQQSRAQGYEEAFGEIIVPTEQAIDLRRGKQQTVKRRLFPGYLFVQTVLTNPEGVPTVRYPSATGAGGLCCLGFIAENQTLA